MPAPGESPNINPPEFLKEMFRDSDAREKQTQILKQAERELRKTEGAFPQGMISDDDEGACAIAIGVESGNVILRFSEPQAWIGLPPQQAVDPAQNIIRKARAIATEPIVVSGPAQGRNEKCACGSGLKYKHCCLHK